MTQEERLQLLKEVSEVRGISGHEKEVSRLIKRHLEGVADHFEYDNLGSTVAHLNKRDPKKPTVLLTAHMDEIGFLVSAIEESGFLRINPVGGWWGHVIPAHEFIIKTREGKEYFAVSGAQPPHGMPPERRKQVMEIKDMYLDLGVNNKKDVEAMGIRIGDTVTPHQHFRVLQNGTALLGKAWDDRVAVAVGIELMKRLKGRDLGVNFVFAGTVQEEVGLRGAGTAAYLVKPDIAFATDVTMSYDLPGSPNNETKLGSGVALSLMDASVIAHRGLVDFVEKIAKEKEIKHTFDMLTAGGTDSGAIHKQFDGIINMTISLPCRYFHSHVSIIDLRDYEATVDLLEAVLTSLTMDDLIALKASKHE